MCIRDSSGLHGLLDLLHLLLTLGTLFVLHAKGLVLYGLHSSNTSWQTPWRLYVAPLRLRQKRKIVAGETDLRGTTVLAQYQTRTLARKVG